MSFTIKCRRCDGKGYYFPYQETTCETCDGRQVIKLAGNPKDYHECARCNGRGYLFPYREHECPSCEGSGLIRTKSAQESEIEPHVDTLSSLIAQIQDPEVKGYVEEGVKCLQIGALRATVVFVWAGAMRTIHEKMIQCGAAKVTAAIQKHDARARRVSSVDHFAYVKDKVVLLAAQELGLFDKNEKDILLEALKLRNLCGHPGKYRPGVKKVSSFIEDITSVLFV